MPIDAQRNDGEWRCIILICNYTLKNMKACPDIAWAGDHGTDITKMSISTEFPEYHNQWPHHVQSQETERLQVSNKFMFAETSEVTREIWDSKKTMATSLSLFS